jgi:cobalt-zinc-cadmium efflux system membrane fusion protein
MQRSGVVITVLISLIAGAGTGAWFVQRQTGSAPPNQSAPGMASMPMPTPSQPAAEEVAITIPPDALERMSLRYAEVKQDSASVEIRVPGTVQPNGYREVRVSPLVGGVATKITVELGQTVKRGQVMAQLFSRELAEAQSEFVGFQAQLEAEHKKLTRSQELVKLGAASREELEGVEASHQVHAAHVEETRQRLLLLGLSEDQIEQVRAGRKVSSDVAIPAPIDGVVTARSLNLGQVVMTGQELFTVTDLSSLWIEGSLLEDHFAAVRAGSRATITTPAYPGRTYRGPVDYIDPRVDPQTRTAKVRVVVENADGGLRLGMYMDMLFVYGGAAVTVVPAQAIQMIGSTSVVFVPIDGEPGGFRQRTIMAGNETAGGRIVSEGVRPGERVVTEGSFLLRAEALRQHPQ